MASLLEVSAKLENSNRGRRPCRSVAELVERLRLDLSDPLGAQPEIGADRGERLGRLTEPVVAPQHGALALIEPVCQAAYDLHLHAVQDVLVVGLRVRVCDRLAERALVSAHRFVEAAREALYCKQAVDLHAAEAGRRRQLRRGRLGTVSPYVLAAG